MRSSVTFPIAAISILLAGGVHADPLVIPGIGPERSPAVSSRQRELAPADYPAPRRHVRYRVAEERPRLVRVAALASAPYEIRAWNAPRLYDDEYRPAAYNAADAFPPPARPWLRATPVCRRSCGW